MVFGARIDEGPRAALLADEVLPERPLRQWVLSLPMALRFLLATRPALLSEVLGVVYRTICGHLLARAGVRRADGHTGAVTLIQRFGSALNLNVYFHMIFVDGVYVTDGSGAPVFRAVRSPGAGELQALVQRIVERIGRLLEKRGLIERDAESAWLSGEPVQAGSLDELLGHCITWRIAAGPRAGQKVFTLQTVAAQDEGEGRSRAAQAGGFSLHAGVSIRVGQRAKLERLCRYVSRWPLAQDRLTLSATGQVCYGFKTPWRDGTTHVVLDPLDFIARLAALVPPPRRHLTRYHGVLAPHSSLRALITPAGRGKGSPRTARTAQDAEQSGLPRHVAMRWAQRLKRVFGIEIESCARCGARLKIVASIEDPAVIARILAQGDHASDRSQEPRVLHAARAPPGQWVV